MIPPPAMSSTGTLLGPQTGWTRKRLAHCGRRSCRSGPRLDDRASTAPVSTTGGDRVAKHATANGPGPVCRVVKTFLFETFQHDKELRRLDLGNGPLPQVGTNDLDELISVPLSAVTVSDGAIFTIGDGRAPSAFATTARCSWEIGIGTADHRATAARREV